MASKYTALLADVQSVVSQIVLLTPNELDDFARNAISLIDCKKSIMEINDAADAGDEVSCHTISLIAVLQTIHMHLLYPVCKAAQNNISDVDNQLPLIQ